MALIRLSKSSIGNEEIRNVNKVLKNEFLGMGSEVFAFEKKLSKYFKRNTICVANGFSALHLAIESLNLKNNDEVLVPSLTFVASFQAITAAGAKPIACDVDLETLNLSVEDLKKKINKKTKVIMPVWFGGNLSGYDEIYKIAKKNKIRVIEDAAHAFGSKKNNILVGSEGDISCFSFDGIKNITSGEGGCIVCDDKKLSKLIKEKRVLGIKIHRNQKKWSPKVQVQGWRYHMSNIMAGVGLAQFKKKDVMKKKRQEIAKVYDYLLKDNKNFKFFKRDYKEINPHLYPVLNLKKSTNNLVRYMKNSKIEIGRHYFPNHLLDKFKSQKLKNTEYLSKKLFTLPIHVDLKKKDQKKIIKLLNNFHEK